MARKIGLIDLWLSYIPSPKMEEEEVSKARETIDTNYTLEAFKKYVDPDTERFLRAYTKSSSLIATYNITEPTDALTVTHELARLLKDNDFEKDGSIAKEVKDDPYVNRCVEIALDCFTKGKPLVAIENHFKKDGSLKLYSV